MTAQGNSGESGGTRYEVADLLRDTMGLGSQAEELLKRANALLENPDVEFPGAARRNTVAEFADLALTVITGLDSLVQQASLADQVQLRKAMIRLLAKIDPV